MIHSFVRVNNIEQSIYITYLSNYTIYTNLEIEV